MPGSGGSARSSALPSSPLRMSIGSRSSAAGCLAAISSMSMPPSGENSSSGPFDAGSLSTAAYISRGNGDLLLDQHRLDAMLADGHAENAGCGGLGLGRTGGQLDAAGLAALARRHLRLDYARPDLPRRVGGLLRRPRQHAVRRGNARCSQQGLGCVLLEVHFLTGLKCALATGLSDHRAAVLGAAALICRTWPNRRRTEPPRSACPLGWW